MRLNVVPKTRLGLLSVKLVASFGFFLMLAMIMVLLGEKGGETFLDNLKISIPMFLSVGSAIAGFIAGLVSIIKYEERSIIVFLVTFIGLIITMFLVGEFTFPH